MSGNITSLSASISVRIDVIQPAPVNIDGFGVDDFFMSEAREFVTTRMSIDRKLSGGVVARAVPLSITLQPNSESLQLFIDWQARQDSMVTPYQADVVISLPALGLSYNLNRGFLVRGQILPPGKQVLEPVSFELEFQSMTVSPI